MMALLAYRDYAYLLALLLARTAAFTLPLLAVRSMPLRLRLAIALSLAAVLLPGQLAQRAVTIPEQPVELARVLVGEVILGLALGFPLLLLLSGMQLAGNLLGQLSGFSLAESMTGDAERMPVMSRAFGLIAVVTFFSVGGHRQLIGLLGDSYARLPAGTELAWSSGEARLDLAGLVDLAAESFAMAIPLAAPLFISLLAATLGFGALSRLAPQLVDWTSALSVNAILTLALLAISVGSVAYAFQDRVDLLFDQVRYLFEVSAAT